MRKVAFSFPLNETIVKHLYFYTNSILITTDKALATRFIHHCVSQPWQLRWASHLNPLAHILLVLPYLGLTAAECNNVCQESVKLEPEPTLLFKPTTQVPTSLLIAKLTMSNTNKPANSIRTLLLLWDSLKKETSWTDFLITLHRALHHEKKKKKKWPLFIEKCEELVSKTPWSEARAVWLKLGL